MSELVHLLGYSFVQNMLLAGVLVATVAGLVSRFVVARSMSFAVHALAEVGFTGSVGFLLLGLSPVLGLLSGSFLVALIIGALGLRVRERDAVVGLVMAFGLGVGVLFLSLYGRYATEAMALLFGAITAVSQGDIILMVVVAVVTIAGLAVMYRPLTFATVDPIVAEARGVPVRLLSILFLLLLAAAVAEAVQVVGVLLILTLLITPGATAERLTSHPGLATLASVSVALLATVGGILLALLTGAPVSFYVTAIAFVLYMGARLGAPALARLRSRGANSAA
ncbi:MAG: metal ABC transporter permease [Candidatus Limnocylindrales bacterium]|jgi:zinc/manganese transport system permease protein